MNWKKRAYFHGKGFLKECVRIDRVASGKKGPVYCAAQ